MKTGVKNDIFWCEIGLGFGGSSGTPTPRILRSNPHPPSLIRGSEGHKFEIVGHLQRMVHETHECYSKS